MIIPLCACGLLVWVADIRTRRVESVTSAAKDELKVAAASPTGYGGGLRRLIVPEHNNDSYGWIAQTQMMFANREWRVRHIDYENAPFGHEVNAPSPYRWWLGLIAWLDHEISGRPFGQSFEPAALIADPLLHLLLLVGATIFVAGRFGVFPASLLSVGLAVIFPFAHGFLPGLPDHHGLAQACGIWSVLLLLAGVGASAPARLAAGAERTEIGPAHTCFWFFLAGVVGGVGLWIGPSSQAPIVAGIALGALLAAWVARRGPPTDPPEMASWRAWALGGAATSLGAYLLEYFPAHLGGWQLRVIHPLYGLAWLGGGELLGRLVAWIRRGKRAWDLRAVGAAVLGVAALAALPVAMWKTHNAGFLAEDLLASKLTKLPDGVVAANVAAWLYRDGFTAKFGTTLLPLLLVLPAAWLLVHRKTDQGCRAMLALGLGPVGVALGFACRQLSWWNILDGMLLVLLVAATAAINAATNPRLARRAWGGFVVAILALGAGQMYPPAEAGAASTFTEVEAKELIKRDLAHWLARQVGPDGAVVLAPLKETASLYYYGGLRGLATLDWENRDGLVAAVRIASATTVEEALELVRRRGITHIIIPSWDSYLDEFARLGLGQIEGSFVSRLDNWKLPLWLRPVSYRLPTLAGLEGQSVTILAVVDEQDDAVAFSREAEYFVEMARLDLAAAQGQALRRFPGDLGALAALLNVELAVEDTAGFTKTFASLLARLPRGADRALPWDRRVSLAIVLARGKQVDLARDQVRHCLAGMDEAGLRSLSTTSLYRLQVLIKAFGLGMADQRLHALALDLTPPEWRQRLQP